MVAAINTIETIKRKSFQVRVISEASPLALSKLYAQLTVLSLVPDYSESFADRDGCLHTTLAFDGATPRDFDLLLRKFAQLTETISVRQTQGCGKQTSVAC